MVFKPKAPQLSGSAQSNGQKQSDAAEQLEIEMPVCSCLADKLSEGQSNESSDLRCRAASTANPSCKVSQLACLTAGR